MLPRIRTNTLTGYAELARSSGLDPAVLMAQVGLDLADLDEPDRWIPAAPAARLLELSAQQSGCPDFGLRLADVRRLGTLGPLSVVLRDEPDLRSAVDLLETYEHTYNEALHLRLQEDGEHATIEVWLEFGEPAPRDQALDLVMATLLGIVRTLVRSDWEPRSAAFARPPPPEPEPWRRRFGPGVVFARQHTGLAFHARELGARVQTADTSLRPYTQQFLRTVVAPQAPAATTRLTDVAEVVELLLPLGRQSVTHTSRLLGLPPRGLQRYLAEQHETFSSILSTTRARMAERYLPNERYSLTEVSQLLGFSAPSAFSRWFHRQFGTSPTEWRRAARDGSRPDAAPVREPGSPP
ncbi:AraC family transcriptional regulator [Geodermatophilus sabuli]|uniref:Transcriptional regulator, AraC family n=1 Tax=Geodermatophilus sabuli TaxID=1564158 RepID=A0A285EDV8_9ACTN|nr:AraC family transcriptional regulator [Geodermatophilus sabuli]MBB3084473.1 AraC-like DNA-binding protein [Geodermatophilus sabuli]SNX97332.1 transcriptional regulator, AraC family [Geodermatophilus sabuli]